MRFNFFPLFPSELFLACQKVYKLFKDITYTIILSRSVYSWLHSFTQQMDVSLLPASSYMRREVWNTQLHSLWAALSYPVCCTNICYFLLFTLLSFL